MTQSCFRKTGFQASMLAIILSLPGLVFSQPCPDLDQTATLSSPACSPGPNPCTLCPGDMFTLNATGTGLQPGACVNWYYGTTNNFNPYNGEGTLLGCAEIESAAPDPCTQCPMVLALFVDACGTEANNEMMAIWSGSGFQVDNATLNFDAQSNGPNSEDLSIGSGCFWQTPNSNAISSIQSFCSGATVVGVGPGESVPAGVPVIIFTSAGYDFNYNFGGICPLAPAIYVMQNGCTRTIDAFDNGTSNGARTTTFGLSCGCSWSTTYNTNSLVGGDGAFVTDAGFPPIYGNAGCGFPGVPGGGNSNPSPIQIPPFTAEVTADMCNGGPYWVVGIIEPVPAGCTEQFTNYMQFDVPCPTPMLGTADVCHNGGMYDLTQLQDPNVPNGAWSGPGVNGPNFDPVGLFGQQVLTFTPTDACGIPTTTTVTVFPAPTASFSPVAPICPGMMVELNLTFTGQGPWTFDLLANNNFAGSYTAPGSPFVIPVNPLTNTNYSLENLQDNLCQGPNASILVPVTAPPNAVLSLIGPDTICGGSRDTLSIDFAGGDPPFIFYYSINGVAQGPDTTNQNPFVFLTPVLTKDTTVIRLDSVFANGCSGVVSGLDTITVLPFPTAILMSDTISLCSGQEDTLRIKFEGPGPYTFQYAVNLDTMPPITTTDTLFNIPITPPLGQNVYKLTQVQGDSCGGVVQGVYSVFVANAPTATLSGDTIVCAGESANISIEFTGDPPFVTQLTANGVPQAPDTSFFSPRIFVVSPDTTTVYQIASVNSGGCQGTVSGQATVVVQPELSATISGGGQICQGGSGTTISISFEGTGPYTFVYRAGPTNQLPITTTDNPYIINVNPPNGTIYQLVSVTNGTCTGTVSGVAVVAVFTPSTAEIIGDITVCSSADTTIMVDFTGSGPFTLVYTANNVPQDTIDTFDDPLFIPINVTTSTVYELVSVESPGCLGIVTGQASVTVNYPPTFTNLSLNCDLMAGNYTVEFDAVDATLPLTLITGSGSFSGAHFTSNPIPIAQGYNFVFHDENDCGDVVVSGAAICNCTTESGDLDQTPLLACTNSPVTGTALGNEMLEPGDVLVFVLHTSSGPGLGTILDVQNQPVFAFQPGVMTIGTTYYISAVAGDSDGMGGVDFSDPCLSVSAGTPVVWRNPPTATMDASFDICPGGQVLIPVTFTGTPPYTLTYTSNGQPTNVLALQNSFSISATLLNSTTFEAISVSDADCMGTASGQAVVTVHQAPQIASIEVVCAPDNATYTVEFDVLNSDLNTTTVTGSIGGVFDPSTGHFTSSPIPAQTGYSAIVTDSWNCGLDSISGGANCSCSTSAGSLDQTPQILCNSDTASIAAATGFFLAPGDTLVYVLVTSPSPAAWSILAFNQNPVFAFDPALMTAGVPYFIVALAGNISPAGIDLNDPCLSLGLGPSITWQPQGAVLLGSDSEICQGDSVSLVALFSGNAPYEFVYQINGVDQPTISTSSSQYLLSVSPAQTSTYTLLNGTANGCPADVGGVAVVTVNAVPQILNPVTICDLSTFTYTLQFDISNGAAPNPAYTISGLTGSFSDTTFTSDPIPSGQAYNITVSTPASCTAQLSGTFTCACLTDAGTLGPAGPLNVCLPDAAVVQHGNDASLNIGDSLQFILYEDPAMLPAGIISKNTTGQFDFQPGMQVGKTYYISAIAGSGLPNGDVDLNAPCLSVSTGVPVVFRNAPTAFVAGDTTICRGSGTVFKINFTGTAPFQFVYSINGNQQSAVSAPQNSFTVSTNNVQQDQVFTLISVQDAFCPGTAMGTYTVHSQQPPTATLSGGTSICSGDSVQLSLQMTGANLYDVTISGGVTPIQLTGITSGATFTVAPATTTSYTIGSFTAQGNNCPPNIGPGVTVTVGPPLTATATLSDYGGFNVSCPNESDGAISINPTGGTVPILAQWSDGPSGLNREDLPAGNYAVTLTDNFGCVFTDTFTLNAPDGLTFEFEAQAPKCFGGRDGILSIQNVQGGIGPFIIRLNNSQVQTTDVFPTQIGSLSAGDYVLSIADINGCENTANLSLPEPALLTVNLGPDTLIYPGDSILLDPLVSSLALDSFSWAPQSTLTDPNSLTTFAKPFQSVIYTLWVQDSSGCQAQDQIRIEVRKEIRVYVPNAFKPDLDGTNDMLSVYTGPEVANIKSFRIFDRWGGNVFEGLDLVPNDPALGWDGSWKGKSVQPGVYVWVVELEFLDGTTEVKSGDVTVFR